MGPLIVRTNVEQPRGLRHVAVSAGDLSGFADRAELTVCSRSRLNRTREARLEEQLLTEQRGGAGIRVCVRRVLRQGRQGRQCADDRPFVARKIVDIDRVRRLRPCARGEQTSDERRHQGGQHVRESPGHGHASLSLTAQKRVILADSEGGPDLGQRGLSAPRSLSASDPKPSAGAESSRAA